jgi:hypothetical protein
VAQACNPSYSGAEIRRILVQSQPGQILAETLSQQNTSQKGAGGVAQVVEHLPSKNEALNSNPSTVKKKKHKMGIILFNS